MARSSSDSFWNRRARRSNSFARQKCVAHHQEKFDRDMPDADAVARRRRNGHAGSRHRERAARGARRPREATKRGGRELRSGRENVVIAEISDGRAEADDGSVQRFASRSRRRARGRATRDGAERVDCLARVIIRWASARNPLLRRAFACSEKKSKLTSKSTSFARTRFRAKGSTERDRSQWRKLLRRKRRRR